MKRRKKDYWEDKRSLVENKEERLLRRQKSFSWKMKGWLLKDKRGLVEKKEERLLRRQIEKIKEVWSKGRKIDYWENKRGLVEKTEERNNLKDERKSREDRKENL